MNKYLDFLEKELESLKESGLYKSERIITSPQAAHIQTTEIKDVVNLCANNYLGLANHPRIVEAAKKGIDQYGYGLSSVRFICGTQTVHKTLEQKLSKFLKTEDTILYTSCFDANTGLFETLLTEEDAIFSDALNHASIIDGIRLCKAKRYPYAHNDMKDLEKKLQEGRQARFRLIVTDGVFSMDGVIANLPEIVKLVEEYDALLMVGDSHSVGVLGKTGAGTPEYYGLSAKIDIYTGTFGKALGGASGGYTSGRKEIIAWLRQRSRPYLFSNSLTPLIAATTLQALDLLKTEPQLLEKTLKNSAYFREGLSKLGFKLRPGIHPIIPVLLEDAKISNQMAELLLKEGVYVISFSYPVVPLGQARIRTQLSALHEVADLEFALAAFERVGRQLKVI